MEVVPQLELRSWWEVAQVHLQQLCGDTMSTMSVIGGRPSTRTELIMQEVAIGRGAGIDKGSGL